MRSLVALVAVVLTALLGPGSASGIYGGQLARGADPGIVTVLSSSLPADQPQLCGAVAITRTMVLTAAHCAENADAGQLTVAAGHPDLSHDSSQRLPVRSIHIDPRRDRKRLRHDFAILVTDPLPVPAVRVGSRKVLRSLARPGRTLRIYGWGSTETGRRSMRMRQADIRLVPFSSCRTVYRKAGIRLSAGSQLCGSADRGRDTCGGDSGGPVMARSRTGRLWLIGVTSIGSKKCATASVPTVYGKLTSARSFLSRMKNGEVPAQPPLFDNTTSPDDAQQDDGVDADGCVLTGGGRWCPGR